MAARKVSPEVLVERDGELGVMKGDKFEAMLNFDFEILGKVSLGTRAGSGAVYKVKIAGEEPRYDSFAFAFVK